MNKVSSPSSLLRYVGLMLANNANLQYTVYIIAYYTRCLIVIRRCMHSHILFSFFNKLAANSLIELLIFGIVCQMLLLMLTVDLCKLIIFGCSKMSNSLPYCMISLSTLPVPEIDLSIWRWTLLKSCSSELLIQERYGYRGPSEPASVNIIDLTWLEFWRHDIS